MALKIVEVHVGEGLGSDARDVIEPLCHECWLETGGRYGEVVSGVMGSDRTGEALDLLYGALAARGELLVLVHALDGVLPRPVATDAQPSKESPASRPRAKSAAAVSREEVYASIADAARFDRTYVALVVLATVVAAIGLTRDNTAAVIGAMVVAPLLGPNMALALGVVLGDTPLVRRALSTNAAGLAISVSIATLLGLAMEPDLASRELASRTEVGVWDLVLALAAGCAGALSYTTGAPTFLTGVMVAVALLPPAVASGLLLSAGEPRGALAAFLLAAGNVTALTLAAMITLVWRGMRPRNWWLVDHARRSARRGITIFVALLLILGGLVALIDHLTAGSP